MPGSAQSPQISLQNYATCRWHGSCRTYPKNANSHVICKVKKTEKCISPVSSVKCLGKKITWHGTSAIVWAPKRCKTCHFTSHMNKDSIWVYSYLLAVRIIQNFPSVPILDVPCPVVNSSSHLMTCHFPFWTSVFSWKSHVMCKFDHLFPCHLSKKWKNTCPLGRRITPMSCVKKKTIAKSIHKSHVMCQKASAKSAAKSRVICAYYRSR